MDTLTPTIPARKQAFLAAQTTLLSQPVTPSRAWRATNDASNTPIRRRLVDDAVFEFNRIVEEHCQRAYAPQVSRNLAERISTIYIGQMDRREGGANDVDGGVGKEVDLSESHANAASIAVTDFFFSSLLKPTMVRLSHSHFLGRQREKPQPSLRMRRPTPGPSPALSNSASSDNKFSSAWKSSAGCNPLLNRCVRRSQARAYKKISSPVAVPWKGSWKRCAACSIASPGVLTAFEMSAPARVRET